MFTLSGQWLLAHDPDNAGRVKQYPGTVPTDARPAPVPGVVQQVFPDKHGVFWYYHSFALLARRGGHRVLLRFGAVDYLADVWVNGRHAGTHEGGETPFALDITDAVSPNTENLLAVRVLNPCKTPIDGFVLAEIPHRNKFDSDQYQPGMSCNYGGIILPVTLELAPAVRVIDVFARPDAATGRIAATVRVQNDTGSSAAGKLGVGVAPAAGGSSLDSVTTNAGFPPGESCHELSLTVPQPRRWDIDDPFLYRVTAGLDAQADGASLSHELSVRCGFRDFRIVDGFFHLNGRRIFLKSTHTGNHFPIGQVVPPKPGLLCRDLLMAKDSGYNAVRFIAGIAYPEQLDFCDEIGLMVYQENLASWCLGDSPRMAERFDLSVREMIIRDRNHPSVAIWGMLNETCDGPVFRHAVDALKLLRSLDPTRLVLLGSGRWDGRFTIGSASNPGSAQWEPVWGVEGPEAPDIDVKLTWNPGGYVDRAGDAHVYPFLPQSDEHTALIRALGQGAKPVFLSEYGIGSQFNSIDELRHYEQAGASPDLLDAALIRSEADRFRADLGRFRLGGVFPFPEDFLRESYRHSVRQRRFAFDVVRSNPQICGYNLTGMLDHGLSGEGMWTLWREWKPGVAECLRDGWAPLRWCLFVDPIHGYANKPLRLEAVLATEDVLAAGEYRATFRLFAEGGTVVWEKAAAVRVPEPRPLAVPVLNEIVRSRLPAGEYVFAACLESGGAPACDRRTFRISDPAFPLGARPAGRGAALTLLGIDRKTTNWLGARGFTCRAFEPALRKGRAPRPGANDVIVVGEPRRADASLWDALRQRTDAGATAVFLSAQPFRTKMIVPPGGWTPPAALPLGDAVTAREFHDWLYHKDVLARPHPFFSGLQTGLLDWDYYGHVVGHDVFDCRETPDETIAAAFALGYCCKGGYDAGVVVACLNHGKGRVILNSLQVLPWLGRHPAADRLALNLIGYARQR